MRKETMEKKAGSWFFAGCVLAVAALIGAFMFGQYAFKRAIARTVVLRVSSPENKLDYDLQAAIAYLKDRFLREGYQVLGTAYPGNLYPQEFDGAEINVYVRGFRLFFDLRRNEEALNIYYTHRFTGVYLEEMQGFDYYLSSQKKLIDNFSSNDRTAFLESGAVWHERLKGTNVYDVLYIYEAYNRDYEEALRKLNNARIYSGMEFARLSEDEKKLELSRAKLVVYEMVADERDDEEYVPYGVYDIMSYGRPVLTNYIRTLADKFSGVVHFYSTKEEMFETTKKVLSIGGAALEAKAGEARDRLLKQKGKFFL